MAELGRMQTVGINREFWADRRVFVTGHTGFMGGWLCLWLARLGAQVTGYALAPPTRPSLFDSTGLTGMVRSVTGDVRDLARLGDAIAMSGAEIVFHLAAQPLVRRAFARPVETFATNLMGTVNLMEALRPARHVAGAVIVTTDKVYDNGGRLQGYGEADRLGGQEAYGASKACAELAVAAYRESYFSAHPGGIGIASVRAGNIVGGGDWASDRLVPDAMSAFQAGRKLKLRHPQAVRPWQHVLEPVSGMLALAERVTADPKAWSEAWNFGPSAADSRPVSAVADLLAELWGGDAGWVAGPDGGPHEAQILMLSSAKAADRLGWRPRWSLERTLKDTVEWYKAHIADGDMREICNRQIAAYCGAN